MKLGRHLDCWGTVYSILNRLYQSIDTAMPQEAINKVKDVLPTMMLRRVLIGNIGLVTNVISNENTRA